MGEYTALIQIITFTTAIAAAAVWLRSQIARQNHAELEQLASTRGQIIDDLKEELSGLRRELDELRGQVKMLQALKTSEIVDGVLEGINHHMLARFVDERQDHDPV